MQLTTEKKKESPCSLCANARKCTARNGRSVWFECTLPLDLFDACCRSGRKDSFKKRKS